MDALIKILGKTIDSPAAEAALEEFELRKWETGDDPPEEELSLVDTAQGVEVQQTAEGVIETIFLYSHGHQGFARFPRPLSHDLNFQSGREAVREAFGPPDFSGPPNPRALLGPTGPWDRYDLPDVSIHFQYRDDRDALALVTLMAPGTAPAMDDFPDG